MIVDSISGYSRWEIAAGAHRRIQRFLWI